MTPLLGIYFCKVFPWYVSIFLEQPMLYSAGPADLKGAGRTSRTSTKAWAGPGGQVSRLEDEGGYSYPPSSADSPGYSGTLRTGHPDPRHAAPLLVIFISLVWRLILVQWIAQMFEYFFNIFFTKILVNKT